MNKLQLKISTFGGLVIATIIIIVQIIHNLKIISDPDLSLLIVSLIFCIGLIYVTILFRRRRFEKCMTYGESLGTGMIITFTTALLIASYAFIFRKYIDPFDVNELLAGFQKDTSSIGSQIHGKDEKSFAEFLSFIYTPINAFIMTFLGYFFGGLFISLISSIFIKKSIKKTQVNSIDSTLS